MTDADTTEAAAVPSVIAPPIGAHSDPVDYSPAAAFASAAHDPVTTAPSKVKRGANDVCGTQPAGSGPTTTPDTDAAFLANPAYSDIATSAPTPPGYSLAFSDLHASTEGNSYLGFYTLASYSPIRCQEHCDAAPACYAFNLYIERDPTLNPGPGCSQPASLANYGCSLWGAQIANSSPTNAGGYRADFHVVVAASNGYNKLAAPPGYGNFSGPTELGGATQAPRGFVGSRFFAGPYEPGQCAASCQASTAYDRRHPRPNGAYDACNFFNSYVLSRNNVPQGTYCAMYSAAWDKSYSTNYGQSRGSDVYSVSQSYGYTLTTQDPQHV